MLRHQFKKRGFTSAVLAKNAVAITGTNEPLNVLDDICLRTWICVRSHRGVLIGKRDVMHLNNLLAQPRDCHAFELKRVSEWRIFGQKLHGCVNSKLRL